MPCRSAILAVKPPDAAAAAAAARDAGATRLLSIAAGVRIETLQSAVGSGVAVVRAMPNTPALVGRGAAAIAGGATAGAADIEWAARILGSVGTVEELAEPLLDAFTGVAGSGPAYLFLVAEALIDSAVAEGLERPVAERVVRQLLVGSALLLDRELDPVRLRAQVTSPGGNHRGGHRRVRRARPARHRGGSRRCRHRPQPRTRLTAEPPRPTAQSRLRRDFRGPAHGNPDANDDLGAVARHSSELLVCFSTWHFSHRHSSSIVRHVETRSPETASGADRAGAIGGLAPALVAFSGRYSSATHGSPL